MNNVNKLKVAYLLAVLVLSTDLILYLVNNEEGLGIFDFVMPLFVFFFVSIFLSFFYALGFEGIKRSSIVSKSIGISFIVWIITLSAPRLLFQILGVDTDKTILIWDYMIQLGVGLFLIKRFRLVKSSVILAILFPPLSNLYFLLYGLYKDNLGYGGAKKDVIKENSPGLESTEEIENKDNGKYKGLWGWVIMILWSLIFVITMNAYGFLKGVRTFETIGYSEAYLFVLNGGYDMFLVFFVVLKTLALFVFAIMFIYSAWLFFRGKRDFVAFVSRILMIELLFLVAVSVYGWFHHNDSAYLGNGADYIWFLAVFLIWKIFVSKSKRAKAIFIN
ncbi:MAG: hypothetical protein WC120_00865 [Parcubacteria group bacterium]